MYFSRAATRTTSESIARFWRKSLLRPVTVEILGRHPWNGADHIDPARIAAAVESADIAETLGKMPEAPDLGGQADSASHYVPASLQAFARKWIRSLRRPISQGCRLTAAGAAEELSLIRQSVPLGPRHSEDRYACDFGFAVPSVTSFNCRWCAIAQPGV